MGTLELPEVHEKPGRPVCTLADVNRCAAMQEQEGEDHEGDYAHPFCLWNLDHLLHALVIVIQHNIEGGGLHRGDVMRNVVKCVDFLARAVREKGITPLQGCPDGCTNLLAVRAAPKGVVRDEAKTIAMVRDAIFKLHEALTLDVSRHEEDVKKWHADMAARAELQAVRRAARTASSSADLRRVLSHAISVLTARIAARAESTEAPVPSPTPAPTPATSPALDPAFSYGSPCGNCTGCKPGC